MTKVHLPADYVSGRRVDAVTVELGESEDGARAVFLGGQPVGYVRKGTRTYSPPTHRGSRIVRYHKQVPEWQGGPNRWSRDHRADTRLAVLRALVDEAREEERR